MDYYLLHYMCVDALLFGLMASMLTPAHFPLIGFLQCMVKHFHSSIAHLLGLTLFSFKYRSPVSLRMVRTYFHSSIAHLELVHTYFHSSIAQLENHGTTYTSVTNDILHS